MDVVDVKAAGDFCGVHIFARNSVAIGAAALISTSNLMNAYVEARGDGTSQAADVVGTRVHAGTLRLHRVSGTLTLESDNAEVPRKMVSGFPTGPVRVGLRLVCNSAGATAATVTAIRLKDANGELASPLACTP